MFHPASRLTAIAAALVLFAGAAFAQAAPQPSQSHLAVAREVAIASGMTRTFDAIIPQLADQLRQVAVTRPEIKADLEQVLEAMGPELEQQKQTITNAAARVFAARMSEAELKDVLTFFKSPSGQKYVKAQPLMLDDLVKELHTWTQTLGEYMMVRARAELGKRGHSLQ